MMSRPAEKEEAIALEIQSDTLLILSGLCENYIQRKVCSVEPVLSSPSPQCPFVFPFF